MSNRGSFYVLRAVIGRILAILMAISLFAGTLLGIAGKTVFDEKFVKDTLEDSDIYEEITEVVKEQALNAYEDTEFYRKDVAKDLEDILDAAVDEDVLKGETEDFIEQVYSGKKVQFRAKHFIKDFSKKANAFMEKNGIDSEKINVEELMNSAVDAFYDNVETDEVSDAINESVTHVVISFAEVFLLFFAISAGCLLLILVFSSRRLKDLSFACIFAAILSALAGLAIMILLGDVKVLELPLSSLESIVISLRDRSAAFMFTEALTMAVIGVVLIIIRRVIAGRKSDY